MSDAMGRLHVHLHSRAVLKLWRDESWAELTIETLAKDDKVFEAELLNMARPKANYDNSKVEDDDETFDGDALTVRKAMQILEDGPSRRIWTDSGHQRLLHLANVLFGRGGGNNSGFGSMLR